MNKLPTLVCLGVLTLLSFGVQAQIVNPALSASLERDVTLPQRDVRRLLNEAQRSDLIEQEREIRRQAKEAAERALSASESQKFGEGIRFFLSSVHFTPSQILTDEETLEAVKPFVGTVVTGKELTAMLGAVNRLYRQKGYVVCQAVLQPQRISKGVLTITLVEGKTGAVSLSSAVEGKEFKTRGSYILRAFDLEKGKVSNYREMLDDLVKFNMTNDIQLSVDMRAGQEPETTDYEIFVQEPDPRTFTLFSDSSGSKSSGRYRGGVSFTERSLLGWRDRLQLIGVFSHGSRSFMGSYSVPLNSFGTRLTASYSYGRVKVVDGPSEEKGDPASVAYDAISSGRKKGMDIVMVDTAGRLPTQTNLMNELARIRKVQGKAMEVAPHEVILVLDGTNGQNALMQANAFDEAAGLTGLIITKLDGTAKGGVLVALANSREKPLPIYYIGVGETIDDLQPFKADEFAAALVGLDQIGGKKE